MKNSKQLKENKRESVASILVTQGNYKFHIVSMRSEILKDTCFTITREDDPELGFQRRLDEKRADEIAAYIDSDSGSIPTAIVLSAQPEAELERNIPNKTLSFKKNKKAFLILDGQHRVWGFIKAKKNTRVPVVIYEGLSRVQEAQLFIDINMNQKEVPKELLLDVKRLLEVESEEEKLCNSIFDNFYRRDDSVLKEHINIGETQKGNLSRVIFNRAISNLLNKYLKNLDDNKKFEVEAKLTYTSSGFFKFHVKLENRKIVYIPRFGKDKNTIFNENINISNLIEHYINQNT